MPELYGSVESFINIHELRLGAAVRFQGVLFSDLSNIMNSFFIYSFFFFFKLFWEMKGC